MSFVANFQKFQLELLIYKPIFKTKTNKQRKNPRKKPASTLDASAYIFLFFSLALFTYFFIIMRNLSIWMEISRFFPHLWSFFISPMSQGETLYCLHKSREKQMLIEQIDRGRKRWKARCQHKQNMAIHCYLQWISYDHKCASNTNYGNRAPSGTNLCGGSGRRADSYSFSARTDKAVASPLLGHLVFKGQYKQRYRSLLQILIQRWQYILPY